MKGTIEMVEETFEQDLANENDFAGAVKITRQNVKYFYVRIKSISPLAIPNIVTFNQKFNFPPMFLSSLTKKALT